MMLDTNQPALPTDVPLLPGELPSFTGLEATGCLFQKDDLVVCFFLSTFSVLSGGCFLLVVAFAMGCQYLMSCDLTFLSCDLTVFPPKLPEQKVTYLDHFLGGLEGTVSITSFKLYFRSTPNPDVPVSGCVHLRTSPMATPSPFPCMIY